MSEVSPIDFYNQWVCTWCHQVESFPYIEGQVYLFHEDAPPPEKYFKMIVDDRDFPVKVRVREG